MTYTTAFVALDFETLCCMLLYLFDSCFVPPLLLRGCGARRPLHRRRVLAAPPPTNHRRRQSRRRRHALPYRAPAAHGHAGALRTAFGASPPRLCATPPAFSARRWAYPSRVAGPSLVSPSRRLPALPPRFQGTRGFRPPVCAASQPNGARRHVVPLAV